MTPTRPAGTRITADIPTAAFLPLVALAVGLQRAAALRGEGNPWTHAAGTHITATVLLAGLACAAQRRRGRGTPTRTTRTRVRDGLLEGAGLLAAPTLLVLWTQSTLSHAAIGLSALAAVAVTLGARKETPRRSAARTFAAPAALASIGVLLVIFGRNTGLGLQLGPTLYLPLSRGPRHPDGATLTALVALVAAGTAWGSLWRRTQRHADVNGTPSVRNTLLILAPGTGALTITAAAGGHGPVIAPATLLGGLALAIAVHGTLRLAAHSAPAAAIATLGGCLASALATRTHYGNAFTTPMLAGALLVVSGVAIARHRIRSTPRTP